MQRIPPIGREASEDGALNGSIPFQATLRVDGTEPRSIHEDKSGASKGIQGRGHDALRSAIVEAMSKLTFNRQRRTLNSRISVSLWSLWGTNPHLACGVRAPEKACSHP